MKDEIEENEDEMDMVDRVILDACCGGRHIWIQKNNDKTVYMDIRAVERGTIQLQPNWCVEPDIVSDYRDMPFDDNTFDFEVGEVASADNSTISFTITGDNNVINSDIDGVSAAVTVTIDNSSSLSTNSSNSDEGVALDIDIDGNGDTNGHTLTLDVTGGGGTIDVTQSGNYDNTLDLDMTGDDFDVDISQTD